MDKWEYTTFTWNGSPLDEMLKLNQLGKEGWGLIQIVNGIGIMKRQIRTEKKIEKEKAIDNTDFEGCWKLYRRKGSKKKSLEQWQKLTPEEQEQVLNHIPAYVESVSDIKYQKDFERYLRDKCFLNVVYKDGKTIFDNETHNEQQNIQNSEHLFINGVIYR